MAIIERGRAIVASAPLNSWGYGIQSHLDKTVMYWCSINDNEGRLIRIMLTKDERDNCIRKWLQHDVPPQA